MYPPKKSDLNTQFPLHALRVLRGFCRMPQISAKAVGPRAGLQNDPAPPTRWATWAKKIPQESPTGFFNRRTSQGISIMNITAGHVEAEIPIDTPKKNTVYAIQNWSKWAGRNFWKTPLSMRNKACQTDVEKETVALFLKRENACYNNGCGVFRSFGWAWSREFPDGIRQMTCF